MWLTDKLNAISGKLDILRTEQLQSITRDNDILARLAHIEATSNLAKTSKVKLGKRAAKVDARTLRLAKYFTSTLALPPVSADYTAGIVNWGMMLNDSLGDCTIAGVGHAIQGWTKLAKGSELTLPDWVIKAYYSSWDGYVAGDPATDQGGVEVDVLNKWRKFGFGFRHNHKGANRLIGYADPDPGNITHVKQAINLFGGVYIGLALPITAQSQSIWDVVGDGQTGDSAPGSWGGHCVWCPKYDDTYVTCVTWGGLTKMTWAYWKAYCDEAHALLSPDFIETNGVAASGFDLLTLQADLAFVTQ